jgi:hypothetical protein
MLTGNREDGVSIEATLQFLRANGLDNLVDGYGIHFYPWQRTAQQTDTNLQNNVVVECRAGGSSGGKPCWITEWGVVNPSTSYPLNDGPRLPTVEHSHQTRVSPCDSRCKSGVMEDHSIKCNNSALKDRNSVHDLGLNHGSQG